MISSYQFILSANNYQSLAIKTYDSCIQKKIYCNSAIRKHMCKNLLEGRIINSSTPILFYYIVHSISLFLTHSQYSLSFSQIPCTRCHSRCLYQICQRALGILASPPFWPARQNTRQHIVDPYRLFRLMLVNRRQHQPHSPAYLCTCSYTTYVLTQERKTKVSFKLSKCIHLERFHLIHPIPF